LEERANDANQKKKEIGERKGKERFFFIA